MKKLKCLLFVAAVALSLVGCQKAVEVSFDGTEHEIEAQGGAVEVALKSNGEWTLVSSAEWLTVTPMSGNGDAMLTLTAEANTTNESRSAEITASTEDNTALLTVTQQAVQYYVNLTPREVTCPEEGGEFVIQVSSNVDWFVAAPQWITSSVMQGSNDATLTLTVNPIIGDVGESREAEVFIGNLLASDKVHVVQTTEPVLGIEISPVSLRMVCTGETKTVVVTTEDSWTALTSAEWLTLSQSEGQGNAEVGVTANENPEYIDREAIVTFITAGGIQNTLFVRQEASPDPHFLEASPLSFQFGKEGGEASITIGCDTDWLFDLDCDWLSVSQLAGTGNAIVTLTAEPNMLMEPRTYEFHVKSGDLYYEFTVVQEAGDEPVVADFMADTLSISYVGGLLHVELTSNTAWTLEASDWITLITSSGEGDAAFDIVVDSNTNPEERIGFVNVKHGSQLLDVLVVVQEGRENILEVSVSELDVRPEGGEFTVHVTANQSWAVTIDVDWIRCDMTSGYGNKDIVITVNPLNGLLPRTGRIKFGGSYGSQAIITVNQH